MGKKNAERYLVVSDNGARATVWAENFTDVLAEVKESAEKDGVKINEDNIVLILKLDVKEEE